MNPKAAEAWNFAIAKLQSARQYIEREEDDLAKTQISQAVYMGAGALFYLLGQGPQEQAAHQAAQGLIHDMADGQACAHDAYHVACKILTCIAELSPEEDRFPPP